MDLFQGIQTRVDTSLTTYVTSTSADVIAWFTPIFQNLMIIYIALWGYTYWMGKIDEPFSEGLKRIIKITVILGLALTVGTYNGWVVNLLYHGPEQLASVVTGVSPSSALLDSLFNKGFEIGDRAWEEGGIMDGDFGMYIVAFIIWIIVALLTAYAAFLLMMSKVALSLLLAVGPLFIAMILFQPTQRWFDSWFGQVINFGLLLVLSVAAVQIVLGLFDGFISSMLATGGTETEEMVAMVAMVFITGLIMAQVPIIASSLGGGFQLSTMGLFGAGMRHGRNAGWRGIKGGAKGSAFAAMGSGKLIANAYRRRYGNKLTGS